MSSAAGVPGTSASSNWKLKRVAVYVRRRPERSAAYQVARENSETWLAQRCAGRLVAGANWVVDPVPGYVERDLRKFLECGILAHGFARARCFIPRALATTEKKLVCAQYIPGKPGAAAAFVFDREGVCDSRMA